MSDQLLSDMRTVGANLAPMDRMTVELAAQEIENARSLVAGYEDMLREQRALVRRLDLALNGNGAAKQASLCDLVAQFEKH